MDVQLVTSHITTTVSNNMQQQQSTILIKNTFDKYKRAYKSLEFYLKKEVDRFQENLLPEQIRELVCQTSFKEFRGLLYSFFENNDILISVSPYDIDKSNEKIKCKWKYYINIDGVDIIDGDFKKREEAEFVSFQKAFEFLDTKLFIKDTSNRFYDESSDSSCLNVNWKHLNKVLNHKRKALISNNNG
jgi:hypothetical protein